jgi:hypothetical protein
MADSKQKIDWDAVRKKALACLSYTWDLISWAERSQNDDYDVERAALHLATIDKAGEVLMQAINMFPPTIFETLARATSDVSSRPDFQFGGVCCATAHESAFLLLRSAFHRIELDLETLGIGRIEQLHDLSPTEVQAVFVELGNDAERVYDGSLAEVSRALHPFFCMANAPLQSLLTDQQLNVVRAWIDREWAVVAKDGGNIVDNDAVVIRRLLQESVRPTLAKTPSGDVPGSTTADDGATDETKASKGGCPRKWDDLIALDETMRDKNPTVSDKEVAREYNKRYAGPIAKEQRIKATAKHLQDARGYRKRVNRETHE